jgi:hypothetical protein
MAMSSRRTRLNWSRRKRFRRNVLVVSAARVRCGGGAPVRSFRPAPLFASPSGLRSRCAAASLPPSMAPLGGPSCLTERPPRRPTTTAHPLAPYPLARNSATKLLPASCLPTICNTQLPSTATIKAVQEVGGASHHLLARSGVSGAATREERIDIRFSAADGAVRRSRAAAFGKAGRVAGGPGLVRQLGPTSGAMDGGSEEAAQRERSPEGVANSGAGPTRARRPHARRINERNAR